MNDLLYLNGSNQAVHLVVRNECRCGESRSKHVLLLENKMTLGGLTNGFAPNVVDWKAFEDGCC